MPASVARHGNPNASKYSPQRRTVWQMFKFSKMPDGF
jgi:hypothetical protein